MAIKQFGLYPRFFVKKKDLLYPLIEKYTGQIVKDKPQGQIIKLYFNLLRTNTTFRDEVDVLIAAQGSKMLTLKEKLMGKKTIKPKAGDKLVDVTLEPTANFINAVGDTTDLIEGDEASFVAAIAEEEKEVAISKGMSIAGFVLLFVVGYILYKQMKKNK